MVGMAVGDVDLFCPADVLDVLLGRVLLQPPAAPIVRADKPRVGGDEGFAIAVEQHGRMPQSSQPVFHGAHAT